MNVWTLQSSGIQDKEFRSSCDALSLLNIPFVDFGLIPFTNEITNLEAINEVEGTLISRTGTKFIGIMDRYNSIEDVNGLNKEINSEILFKKLQNSIDYDIQKFDQRFYSQLDLPLLNSDSRYFKYSEVKDVIFENDIFVKPTTDLKSFNAMIVKKGWTISEEIERTTRQRFNEDEEYVLVSTLKEVEKEYRFFIYNDEVIGGSRYPLRY